MDEYEYVVSHDLAVELAMEIGKKFNKERVPMNVGLAACSILVGGSLADEPKKDWKSILACFVIDAMRTAELLEKARKKGDEK